MRANPDTKLGGDKNECPSCGELFNSVYAFDAHRKGRLRTRRCMTDKEMMYSGMSQANEFWITKENCNRA